LLPSLSFLLYALVKMPLSEAEYTALAVSDHLALNARLDSPPDSVTQSPRSAYSTDLLLGPTTSEGREKGRGKGKREREEARTCVSSLPPFLSL